MLVNNQQFHFNVGVKPQKISKKIGDFIYFTDKILGYGGSSVVYQCKQRNQQGDYACKVIPISQIQNQTEQQNIEREIETLKTIRTLQFDSKHLCRLKCIQRSQEKIYIITEMCNQGTLERYFHEFKPNLTRIILIFSKIVSGYKELNKINVVHRDLKLQNILMHDHQPKIIDYGFSKILNNAVTELMQSNAYTYLYISPQQRLNQQYTYKKDIFCLGIILYLLVNDLNPYGFPKTYPEVEIWHNQIKQAQHPINILNFKKNVGHDIQTLISDMLEFEEDDRISIDVLKGRVDKLALQFQTISDPNALQYMIQQANIELNNNNNNNVINNNNNYNNNERNNTLNNGNNNQQLNLNHQNVANHNNYHDNQQNNNLLNFNNLQMQAVYNQNNMRNFTMQNLTNYY